MVKYRQVSRAFIKNCSAKKRCCIYLPKGTVEKSRLAAKQLDDIYERFKFFNAAIIHEVIALAFRRVKYGSKFTEEQVHDTFFKDESSDVKWDASKGTSPQYTYIKDHLPNSVAGKIQREIDRQIENMKSNSKSKTKSK